MRGAGCTWNDLTDRDFDARVARTRSRPLPSGQVSPRQAAAWMWRRRSSPSLILLSFPREAVALGVASLASSRSTPSPSGSPGGRRSSSGSRSTGARSSAGPRTPGGSRWAPLLLYAAGIAWTLFYDTIYAHQDREDDALIGVKSTARLFGAATKRWLAGFLALSAGLAVAAVLAAGLAGRRSGSRPSVSRGSRPTSSGSSAGSTSTTRRSASCSSAPTGTPG